MYGKISRSLLSAGGFTSLGLGLLGIALPLVPTTPFLLLSAWCFGKSSPRLLRWLLTNRLFGEYLRNYRDNKGIPRRVKIYILGMLWATILLSARYATSLWWVRLLLILIAAGVTFHLFRIKNFRPESVRRESLAASEMKKTG